MTLVAGVPLAFPFDGIPLVCQLLLMLAFVVIVGMCAWTAGLFVRGQRAIARAPEVTEHAEDAWTWVFLVAALNEEITIADSVERLLALKLAQRKVIVIDDGSNDMTQEILSSFAHPDLVVLRRDLPNARRGQGAGAERRLPAHRRAAADADRSKVIVVVVDADGRIAARRAPFRGRPLRGSRGRRRAGARPHLQPRAATSRACRTSSSPSTAASTRRAERRRHRGDGRQRAVQPPDRAG